MILYFFTVSPIEYSFQKDNLDMQDLVFYGMILMAFLFGGIFDQIDAARIYDNNVIGLSGAFGILHMISGISKIKPWCLKFFKCC